MKEISDAIEKQLRGDGIVNMFLEGHSLDITLDKFNIGSGYVEQIQTYTGSLELNLDYKGQRGLFRGIKAKLVLAVHTGDALKPEQIPALFRKQGLITFNIYRESEFWPLYELSAQFGKESGKVRGDQDFITQAFKLIYENESAD